MKYSIVIPHLSNSKYINQCIDYIKQNSIHENEIITIVDEPDVYYAFNRGVYQSSCDIVVLLNDDMFVSKNWDKHILTYANPSVILTGHVVEASPGPTVANRSNCVQFDCGQSNEDFDYNKFQEFVDLNSDNDIKNDTKGWYMPLIVNKKTFISFPNIVKFPKMANDIALIDHILPFAGFRFVQIDMWVYHFSKKSLKHIPKQKNCVFSYCNNQIDPKISLMQNLVIDKLNILNNYDFEFLKYLKNDGEVYPDQAINYAFGKLFYETEYDNILLLDIDCIPLNNHAIQYMFDKASQGYLIGNIQRSNHISNNEHVFVAPSAMCLSRDTFEKLNKPSFTPTFRSDVGEELTYIAESHNVPIELLMPSHYEELPQDEQEPWDLKHNMPKYGIGTTFVNGEDQDMFYHLFQSRFHRFNELFYSKCRTILEQEF